MTVVVSVAVTMCVGPALSTVRMRFIKVVLMEVKQSQQHQHKNQTAMTQAIAKSMLAVLASAAWGIRWKKATPNIKPATRLITSWVRVWVI